MGKRLQDIGVENTEENRRKYRQLLFSSDPVSNTSFSKHVSIYFIPEKIPYLFNALLDKDGTLI